MSSAPAASAGDRSNDVELGLSLVTPTPSIYDSSRLAAGYARHRPPVHDRVLEFVSRRLGIREPRGRGLDIGCGAGLSTAALSRLTSTSIGMEPVQAMLAHSAAVAPAARFVVGGAEMLPFGAGQFDLITAAGALNYTDLPRCLAEVARVLAPGGWLVIYDFSSGRRSPEAPGLDGWFEAFEREVPFPPGYAMDVQAIDFAPYGLALDGYQPYEVLLPISKSAYLEYVLTETNVERAIREGQSEADVRRWCARGLDAVFARDTVSVAFTGYYACVKRALG